MPGTWKQITIAGKQADVFEPTEVGQTQAGVLHLHGHGLTTLRDNPAFTRELERHGLPTICPHGQRSWWTETICSEFDAEMSPLQYLQEHVIPAFDEFWGIRPPLVGLMGISMGGQGAFQLGFRRPRDFPVVAALAPAVDFHNWHGQGLPLDEMFPDKESARQATATLQLRSMSAPRHQLLVCDPTDQEWFEGAERLASKMYASGIPYECDFTTSHGGHSWDYFDYMSERVVGFVAERLEQESHRE